MSKEYIDREEVIKILEQYDLSSGSTLGCHSGAIECAISAIEMLPAADVTQVVHGRWIGIDSSFWKPTHRGDIPVFRKTYRCSECRRRTAVAENYCPNCGAKMDKEEADDKKQPEEAPGE